jgi:hypothetical protein
VSDDELLDADDPSDEVDSEQYYSAARSSVIIGILVFFPGVALIFIWYLFGAVVLAGALVGLYRGISALRHSARRSRIWMAALVGTVFCGADIAIVLVAIFAVLRSK